MLADLAVNDMAAFAQLVEGKGSPLRGNKLQVHTSHKVEKVIVTGFLLVILVGALLLWFSNNFIYGMPLSVTDSMFLSTSAVCVTGLSTVSVARDGAGLSDYSFDAYSNRRSGIYDWYDADDFGHWQTYRY